MREPDAQFADPRLARLYDPFDDDRGDLDVYVAMAEEFGAARILDVGCGTGELAVRLVDDHRRRGVDCSMIIGVDPAEASLAVARSKPGADAVRWIHGVAPDAAHEVAELDLVVMTGNVAQVFVADEDWAATLVACRRVLAESGCLVFETRDPARRAWEGWSGDGRRRTVDVAGVGLVEYSSEVTAVELPLVTFDATYRFVETDEVLTSTSTLRFRDLDELSTSLTSAGFTIDEVRDAPDRPGLEFVVIARPTIVGLA